MIWVIGGTKDSRDFLDSYLQIDKNIIVSTATEYGGKLLENLDIKISTAKMDKEAMLKFIDDNNIKTIVDISHPYAFEVSKNAIEVSKEKKIKYFRYERKKIEINAEDFVEFSSMEEIIEYISDIKENIFVTLGSNNINYFKNLKNLSQIYFRILPKWDMVKKCEDNGILPKNIIAMQGPFLELTNIAMIEQFNIKYLITKRAGITGGEIEKIEACNKKNVKVIYLGKKDMEYINCYDNLEELIEELNKK